MRQHYFIKAFAVDGTNTPDIPNAADPSGFVSWAEGWTFDYQRNLLTDPAAKSPTYINFNNFGYEITLALKDYQENGSPEFITSSDNGGSAFSYRIGAIVRRSAGGTPPFGLYLNNLDNNTNTPGGTGWIDLLGVVARLNASGAIQKFTSSGIYTVPPFVTAIDVEGWSGGGGGGYGAASNAGSGGGAGGYGRRLITGLTPGATITITIGAGGAGGTVGSINGVAGGASSIGAYVTITGGTGGGGNASIGAAGGVASSADFAIAGGNGFASLNQTTPQAAGPGGAAPLNAMEAGYTYAIAAAGIAPGNGGGGGADGNNGAAGAGGTVIIRTAI